MQDTKTGGSRWIPDIRPEEIDTYQETNNEESATYKIVNAHPILSHVLDKLAFFRTHAAAVWYNKLANKTVKDKLDEIDESISALSPNSTLLWQNSSPETPFESTSIELGTSTETGMNVLLKYEGIEVEYIVFVTDTATLAPEPMPGDDGLLSNVKYAKIWKGVGTSENACGELSYSTILNGSTITFFTRTISYIKPNGIIKIDDCDMLNEHGTTVSNNYLIPNRIWGLKSMSN